MSLTCHITGSVIIPDGSSAANRQITLRKEDFTLSAQGTVAILPEELTVYTDALGNVSFDLVAGTYSGYYVSHPQGRVPFRLRVPSDATAANFADLIVVTSVTDDPALTQAVLEAYQSLDSRSNSMFGIGDNPDGQSYDVVIASPAIVGETTGLLPAVTVEVETGVVRSLLTSEAGNALIGFDVRAFGGVGDGVTDDRVALQAAINAATAVANEDRHVTVKLSGGSYAISGTVYMDTASFVTIEGGGIVAIGSAWSTTTPILTMNNPSSDNLVKCGMRDVYVDCRHLCSGIRLQNTLSAFLENVHVVHAKNYHIKADTKNTELTLLNCVVNQFFWGEAGFDLIANRTAYGFWVSCADTKLIGCTGYYCLEPLRGESWNIQVSACHFYNGATVDGTDNIGIHLYGAHCYLITDTYLDKGILRITGGSTVGISGVGGEFNHSISGICVGPGNTTTCIELVTVDPNDNASGLKVDLLLNGRTVSSARRLAVNGSGSWSYLKSQIVFRDRDGGIAAHGKLVAPDGDAAQPGLLFSSEADTNTGFYRKAADQVGFSAGGVGRFFFNTSGISAESAGVGSLGTEGFPFFTTHTRNLRLVEGVSTPTTTAGYAILYVDSADGDLKVRFGDGTIKTIMTDT